MKGFLPTLVALYHVQAVNGIDCCSKISHLGVSISNRSLAYFSTYQSDLHPACVAHPSTPEQISAIFTLKNSCDFKFAVRGGGHMTWAGASSIGAPGFTIDLGKFQDISYDRDTELVTFGAGLRWGTVYELLERYDRTTRGGRALDVGVSGFLLGGGIPFPGDIFSSFTVQAYKIVLASGSVIRVSEDNHPDLFWALRFGSTNFGVVVQFTMKTQPYYNVWGGTQMYQSSAITSLTESLVKLTLSLNHESTMSKYIGLAFIGGYDLIWVPRVAFDGPLEEIADPQWLLSNTVGRKPLHKYYQEMTESALAQPTRHDWWTLTICPDARFVMDIFDKGKDMYGVESGWSLGLQPLPGHLFDDGESVIILLFMSSNHKIPLQELVSWTERHVSMVKPFVYMNYASGHQETYRGLDLTRLADARRKYDPVDLFGKHWEGGFKLPSAEQYDRSEL